MDVDTDMADASSNSPTTDTTPEEFKAEGNELYKAGKYSLAVAAYSKAISLDPNNATFLGNRAAAFMLIGEFQKALADSTLANSLAANVPKTLHRIQQAETSLSTLHQAQSALDSKEAGMTIHCLNQLEKTLSPKATIPVLWRRLRADALLLRGEGPSGSIPGRLRELTC